MCFECWKVAKKYYPELDDRQTQELLWGATCYPFGEPDQAGEFHHGPPTA